MMYFLLAASIVLATVKSSVYNSYAKKVNPNVAQIFLFNTITYLVGAIVAFLFGIGESITLATFLCAIGYAVIVFSLQALSVMAMTMGNMSTISLLVLYGMIIPALAGPIFWKEKFGILQAIGVVLILISIWLLREKKESGGGKKLAIFATLCFIVSGLAGVIEKVHQSTNGRDEKTMLLFVAYLFMLVFSAVGFLFTKSKFQKQGESIVKKPILIFGAVTGVIVILISQTNLTLAGGLDSLIYYPVANGGALLLTVLVSATIFKEKLTKMRVLGFVLGLVSILLLSFPV